ncbi:hypothetical protein FGO68_gene2123 [Halteria grandinella]|uniref:SPIN90/Ldb17 leucine-rich domain-containing protein n=1 Tax=Halteria grandinella TaxID=5974 RepID=A0A8J8NQ64_HALGN|nr:hypothetical protein FGO68_gene2123 [Halteria grandinella]
MESQIDALYSTLLRVDTEPDNKALIEWLENVCQRHYGLVDGLVANFIVNIDEPAYGKKLLKVLKKLNEYLPTLVTPQFMENQRFPEAIIQYLEGTELKDMAGDAFVLLVNVFNDQSIDKMSDKFVRQLIDSMEFITDENTTHALISILVILCAAYEKKIQKQIAWGTYDGKKAPIVNLAYQEFIQNESYYRLKLLHLTNRSNRYRFDKCLETLSIILSKEESKDFFNINDLNLLLDICLREIQTEKDPNVRVQILRMIETIMDHEQYKTYPYKLDDIRDTVNELILSEDEENGAYTIKEKESIAKLNLKFQILNF